MEQSVEVTYCQVSRDRGWMWRCPVRAGVDLGQELRGGVAGTRASDLVLGAEVKTYSIGGQ